MSRCFLRLRCWAWPFYMWCAARCVVGRVHALLVTLLLPLPILLMMPCRHAEITKKKGRGMTMVELFRSKSRLVQGKPGTL